MERFIPALLIATLPLMHSCDPNRVRYPHTPKGDVVDTYFGVQVPDPYRWLEDSDSPQVRQWVEQQNAVTFAYLEAIPFRDQLRQRLTELWDYNSISTPRSQAGQLFFFKQKGLQNQDVLYVQDSPLAPPRVLVDPNLLCPDGTVAIGIFSVSHDGQHIAYTLAEAGSDWHTIRVRRVDTGEPLDGALHHVKFSDIAWFRDGFFYSRYDPIDGQTDRTALSQNHQVYYHRLGTPQSADSLVFRSRHPLRIYRAMVTHDQKYLIISESESTHGNSLFIRNLNEEQDFIQLTTGFDYSYELIGQLDDNLYVLTNYRAPKYKLIRININSHDVGNWRDVIPEQRDVLEACLMVDGKILALYIEDAKSRLDVFDLSGQKIQNIALPALSTVVGLSANITDTVAYYTLSSFTVPSVVHTFNTRSLQIAEFFRPAIAFNFDQFQTQQVFYTSRDGTEIPMFIVHRQGLELNGQNPTLLYGYGGFNVSLKPAFNPSLLAWLEQGGVFAMANLRGGGEYGENWYRAGTKLNKQNVFDDFIAAAEYLIDQKYTSPRRLAIQGSSNGGLLIGAVVNQRPDLFGAANPNVGVMDMLRFHKFTIGWAWVNDYGSSDDSIQFLNLYRYSPLHNVRERGRYPAILVTTADNDDRVVPAHSYKYIATLQEKLPRGAPKLIRVETRAGHGAGTPTSQRLQQTADVYSFMLYNLGVQRP